MPESANPDRANLPAVGGMTRWQVFRQVATWLRPVFSTAPLVVPSPAMSWERIVEAASHHMVAPAIGWALINDRSIEGHVADYFEAILDLNRMRNGTLLDVLATVLGALNAAGIRPVPLKGAAFLVDNSYPDPGIRILADLDLLVPEAQLQAASSALIRVGFGAPRTDSTTPAHHHHLPAQTHAATGITVELHRQPTERPFLPLVDSLSCFGWGGATTFRGGELVMPSPTERIALNIVHGQLSNRHHRRGVPELRQLLDLAVLRALHEAEVDWDALAGRFRTAGHERVLADMLTCAEFLIGQEMPAGIARRPGAIVRMERVIERSRGLKAGAALLWTLRDAASALKADPRRLVTAIRHGKWRSAARDRIW